MIMPDSKYISLNPNVFICKGYHHSLLMNCNNGKIFQLDIEAVDSLNAFLTGQVFIRGKNSNDDLVDYLLLNNLICLSEKFNESLLLPEAVENNVIKTVWIELRKSCNLKCVHCYNNSNPNSDRIEDLLTLDEWKSVILQLKAYQPKSLVFIGGEPILYKNIDDLIKYANGILKNSQLVLYSNLTLLNQKLLNTIKECNVKVITSLYSDSESIHDSITQSIGSFNKTVHSINILKENGVDVRANTVVMKTNQHCVNNTIEYIKSITNFKPKVDVIRCVNDDLLQLAPTNFVTPHVINSLDKFSPPSKLRIQRAISGNACWQGKINISCNGYISPCIMWEAEEKPEYNLKKQSLNAIMQEYIIPKYWRLSKDKIETCKVCEYRYICSDCRPIARSLEKRGNVCNYNPYNGEWESHL